jgi:Icc-related predicted phosphoesterase
MLVISDVHLALEALRRVVAKREPMLILGDLVNLSDYRTGEGAVAEVLGIEFAKVSGRSRGQGDYQAMRSFWREVAGDRGDELRSAIAESIDRQYEAVAEALRGGHGLVIHGNVDRPDVLKKTLPEGFEYVHAQKRMIDGVTLGFLGGGMETPLRAEGEVPDDEMREILAEMGPVDILCSHVPPAIGPLRTDVITGRAERGSAPILEFLRQTGTKLHLFGDVHQPQAQRWRVGETQCQNVGYFRATGRAFPLDLSHF